jgi:hypothetical protein
VKDFWRRRAPSAGTLECILRRLGEPPDELEPEESMDDDLGARFTGAND